MNILIDAMGGDLAPRACVEGALSASKQYGETLTLVGHQDTLRALFAELGATESETLRIHHAPDVITMHDDPSTALRRRPESSMAVAMGLLKAGEGDAVVSAGNTGALLTGATLYGGRIRGIRRAALAPLVPCKGGQLMLLDVGANTECTAEYLLQFGILGSLYMQHNLGIAKPRVGLINNGTEETKGDALRREAHALLTDAHAQGVLHFVGNVEARDVPLGVCDVAVVDGFTGNIMLKTIEGVARFMGDEMKSIFSKNLLTKLSYLACKGGIAAMKANLSQDKAGAAPFLGVRRPVFKAHGSSNAEAFQNAIRQAIGYVQSDMQSKVELALSALTKAEEVSDAT